MLANNKMPKHAKQNLVSRRAALGLLTLGVLISAQCTPISRSVEVPAPERQTIALGPAIDIATEGCQITIDDAVLEARVPSRDADRRLDTVQTEIKPFIVTDGGGPVTVTATAMRTLRFARSGTFIDTLRGNFQDETAPVALVATIPTRMPTDDPLDCPLLPRLVFVVTDYDLARDAAAAAGLVAGINPPPDTLLVNVEVTIQFDGQPVIVGYTRAVRVNVTSTGEVLYAIGNGDGVLHDALGTTPSIRRP